MYYTMKFKILSPPETMTIFNMA